MRPSPFQLQVGDVRMKAVMVLENLYANESFHTHLDLFTHKFKVDTLSYAWCFFCDAQGFSTPFLYVKRVCVFACTGVCVCVGGGG